jgi:hypothetical protein
VLYLSASTFESLTQTQKNIPIKNAAMALIGNNRFSPDGYSQPLHHPASTLKDGA